MRNDLLFASACLLSIGFERAEASALPGGCAGPNVPLTSYSATWGLASGSTGTLSGVTTTGQYSEKCGEVEYIETVSFTLSTAGTGALNLSLPVTPNVNTSDPACYVLTTTNLAWPNTDTQLLGQISVNGLLTITGQKSSAGNTPWATSNLPTGTAITFSVACHYPGVGA
jgi:hypothetical protein